MIVEFFANTRKREHVNASNRKVRMAEGQATGAAIHLTLPVPASAERAYAVFGEEFASWYPKEYTWSQDVLDTIGMEGREGGRCFECGPEGFWIDWGRVLVWNPPNRLAFS